MSDVVFRSLKSEFSGRIFLHSMPGRFETLAACQSQLQAAQVTLILCLTSRDEVADKSPEYAQALMQQRVGVKVLEFAVQDFSIAEDIEAYRDAIREVARVVSTGDNVLIHCAAGIGRTGSAAICLLYELGVTISEAKIQVAAAGSGPETLEQLQFFDRYQMTGEQQSIRAFSRADFEAVQAIYLEGIASGNATFQTRRKSWEQWQASMSEDCRLVACDATGHIIGWAGLSAISSRDVYRGVAEVSVYISTTAQGQGLGSQLLQALVDASEAAGYWTLQAAIFPENQASLNIHQHCGFSVLGKRQKLGKMHGIWRDVMLLERRSQIQGID